MDRASRIALVRRGRFGTRFPREMARDLLGIVRALYRSEKSLGRSSERLRHIAGIGERLSKALELSRNPEEQAVAWAWLDEANLLLQKYVTDQRVASIVSACVERLGI